MIAWLENLISKFFYGPLVKECGRLNQHLADLKEEHGEATIEWFKVKAKLQAQLDQAKSDRRSLEITISNIQRCSNEHAKFLEKRLQLLEPLAIVVTDDKPPLWDNERREALDEWLESALGQEVIRGLKWHANNQAQIACTMAQNVEHANGMAIGFREMVGRLLEMAVVEPISQKGDALIAQIESRRFTRVPDDLVRFQP